MRIKTSELIDAALDFAVALARDESVRVERGRVRFALSQFTNDYDLYSPSTDWAQGGPLLNQHKISRTINHSGLWIAYAGYNLNDEQGHMQCDRSELVAGLRCLVALSLGEVVDVPEELL